MSAAGALRRFRASSRQRPGLERSDQADSGRRRELRTSAADALGAFRLVPDKGLAWKDLIRLTQDKTAACE